MPTRLPSVRAEIADTNECIIWLDAEVTDLRVQVAELKADRSALVDRLAYAEAALHHLADHIGIALPGLPLAARGVS